MEDVSHLTGENDYRRPPKTLILNEIRFSGNEGTFKLINNIDRKKGEKSIETDLGRSINFIVLKIRRRIQVFNRDLNMYYTSTEHNSKEDSVYMFGSKDKGVAGDLYELYKGKGLPIKAQRVIYGFLIREGEPRELVRLIVKGMTLNTQRDGKSESHMDFFTYTQREKPKSDHIYMFVTEIYSGEEKTKLGKKYAMYFKQGQKLASEQISVVVEEIKKLAQIATDQDNYYKVTEADAVDATPTIEYPEEEIDPADIPF